MAAFHFKLQPLLDLREEKEKESARGLAEARVAADEARHARENLEAVLEAGRVRVAEAHGSGGPVGHLQNLALVVGSMDAHLAVAEDACRQADEHVERSMRAFQEALQQRRTIDHLRSRRLQQWRAEQTREEQKVMDEFAITRHGRAGQASSDDGKAR